MFKNSKEAGISVFPFIVELEEQSMDGNFSLYQAIYDYIIATFPTDGCNISEEINEYYLTIDILVRPYLLSNNFIQKVNNFHNYGIPCTLEDLYKLTDKGKEAKKLEGIDKYEEKEKKVYEMNKLKEENLKAPIEANKIAKNAKNISFGALLFTVISCIITAAALFNSMNSSDSNKIKVLNDKIEQIEYNNVLLKERLLESDKEYVKHIDSLYGEINKLKNK